VNQKNIQQFIKVCETNILSGFVVDVL